MQEKNTLPRRLRSLVLPAAIAIGGLAAAPAIAQSEASPQSLQSLVNQTAAQFRLSYRHNAVEHQRRYQQLAAAVAAWHNSPRGAEENRHLAEWLRGAIESSMPGSHQSLAAVPDFAQPARPIAASSGGETRRHKPIGPQSPTSPTGAAPSRARSEDDFWSDHPASAPLPADMGDASDPFRDDPAPAQ